MSAIIERKSNRTVLIEGSEAGRDMVRDCLALATPGSKRHAFYQSQLAIWQTKIDKFTAMTEEDATRFFTGGEKK